MRERLVKARPHDWIIPKKIILGLFIAGIVIGILGIILVSIGSPTGLYATGKALLGVGICFLSICLLLCLYAHHVWYVVDEETQTWGSDSNKATSVNGTSVSDGTPAIFDLEMVDGGYPTKTYDKNKITPQPSPKRVRISPTTHIVDGPSGKERTVPTIITSSEETPKSSIRATAVAVTSATSQPSTQQQHQQQLHQQQQQELQQQQLQQQLQQQQLQQQQLQQQVQEQVKQQQLHQQQLQQQQLQQQKLQLEQNQQLQQQQQQQLQQQQQQLQQQQQQLQQQYQQHYYQPTQVTSAGRPSKPDQTPGYADYEPVTGRVETNQNISQASDSHLKIQQSVPSTVPGIALTDGHLPPTGASSTRVTAAAQYKPITMESFSINTTRGGVPYTSTPIPRGPSDTGLNYQQQQQQHYQTLIQQQKLQNQQQQQQLHQTMQRSPIIVEPRQPQSGALSTVVSNNQGSSVGSSERSASTTVVSSVTQQQTTSATVEDDDYDETESMPILGTYPRRQWLQDLENPPEPTPLQYPSAKRPMTFRNTSSSKVSIYDNVSLPYVDNQ